MTVCLYFSKIDLEVEDEKARANLSRRLFTLAGRHTEVKTVGRRI
jgi:hypothetical protein